PRRTRRGAASRRTPRSGCADPASCGHPVDVAKENDPMTEPVPVTIARRSPKRRAAFDLNGESVDVLFAPYKTLLEVLREDLALTGTKHGCELGECGACTVLLDGAPVLACLVLGLDAEGRSVTTIEGMQSGAELHPLQEAFAELGAAQCGYCTPGFLLAAEALVDANPAPSRDEI